MMTSSHYTRVFALLCARHGDEGTSYRFTSCHESESEANTQFQNGFNTIFSQIECIHNFTSTLCYSHLLDSKISFYQHFQWSPFTRQAPESDSVCDEKQKMFETRAINMMNKNELNDFIFMEKSYIRPFYIFSSHE